MKKLLLSGLLITLSCSTAIAENMEAKLNGSLTFEAATRIKEQKSNISNLNKNIAFFTQGKIAASITTIAEQGVSYGGVFALQGNANNDSRFSKDNLDRSYLFLQCLQKGRLEIGSNYTAANMLKVDTKDIVAGSGGTTGNWYRYTSITLLHRDLELLGEDVLKFSQNKTELARRLTYYTPDISGLQLGISYTPDGSNRGTNSYVQKTANISPNISPFAPKDEVSLAAKYSNKFEQVTVAASITSRLAKMVALPSNPPQATVSKYTNLRSVAVGGIINYEHITLAGSYGKLGNSANLVTNPKRNAAYYTAGIGYDQGPFNTSFTYLKAKSNNQRFQLASIGLDYRLAAGLTPYLEASKIKNKDVSAAATYSGKATVFIAGMKLVF